MLHSLQLGNQNMCPKQVHGGGMSPRLISFVIFSIVYFWLAEPPSAPRNVNFNINETALYLEWSPPFDTGGRKDLFYNVICKKCGIDLNHCELCGGGIRFVPQHSGLVNASVVVLDFLSHVNYTFEIEAINGVTELSLSARQHTSITITTDQEGTFSILIKYLVLFLVTNKNAKKVTM